MNLNAEQKTAAEVTSRHALILAGPGTGKTTALVGRYAELLKRDVPPSSILCCTFARKAADELKGRIKSSTGIATSKLPIGTFHSLANRAVRELAPLLGIEPPTDVLRETVRRKIITEIRDANEDICKALKFDQKRPSTILTSIDDFRERLLSPDNALVEASESADVILIAHAEIYALYDQHLTKHKLIDYARMIQFAVRAFELDAAGDKSFVSRYGHILVDEFQDINFAQKKMLDGLLKGGGALWVVGDDDQAIYGWRGSSLDYILNFDRYFAEPQIVALTQNYRSTPEIVDAANGLAGHFLQRREKTLTAVSSKSGEIHFLKAGDEEDEASKITSLIKDLKSEGFDYGEMAVLARTNALPSDLVEELILEELPVTLADGVTAFDTLKAKELLTACAIATSQTVDRTYNRKLGPKLFSFAKRLEADAGWDRKVKALATYMVKNLPTSLSDGDLETAAAEIEECRDFLCKFESANTAFMRLNAKAETSESSIHVGTIHGAKGLEWDAVIIMGCEDDKIPHSLCETPAEFEEERRLFYVGITRARHFLGLSRATERDNAEKSPSPFLSEIQNKATIKSGKVSDAEFSEMLSQMRKWGEEYDHLRQEREERESAPIAADPSFISTTIADGWGAGNGWQIRDTGNGFLKEVGYTAKVDGPNSKQRQAILADVFYGRIHMPDSIRESVAEKWGTPNSVERLRKIRNTINVALGTQKGRAQPSTQAIAKWEEDLGYIDNELKTHLEDEE